MGIVVMGATFVDIKGFPRDTYVAGGCNVGQVKYVHGGVARNVVEDIANIGLQPTYVGIVDDTPMGGDVVRRLRERGVNTDYMLTRPGGMGTWLAIFNENGDLAGSISQRPNMLPLLEVLEEKGDEIFSEADSVILEIDLNREIVEKSLELAQKYGTRLFAVVSNMTIAAQHREAMEQFACVICNCHEAGILFGEDYSAMTCAELQALLPQRVAAARIPSMVVTMGAAGSVYVDAQGNAGSCPACKVEVCDTTGAGDSFCAGVSAGLTYGKTMAEAVEIGTCLAAKVITSLESVCPCVSAETLGFMTEQ